MLAMQVTLAPGNVEGLVVLADRLQIAEVTRACIAYMLDMLEKDLDSAIAMYAHSLKRVKTNAMHYCFSGPITYPDA
jgi:hypothetical protein